MKKFSKNIMLLITILLSITYIVCNVIFTNSDINQLNIILNSSIIGITSLMFTLYYFRKKNLSILATLINILLVSFLFINILTVTDLYKLPTKKVIGNLTKKSITEVMEFANNHNIKVNAIYENSESIDEYIVISQDVPQNTLISEIKELNLIVSEGKDINKLIIIPNMIGWDTEKVINYVNENNLTNVDVEFTKSSEKPNIVIAQSKNGELKRSDSILLTFAMSQDFEFIDVEMIDLKTKSLFEATLWAKQNGINVKKEFAFNDDLKNTVSLKSKDGKTTLNILQMKKGIVINQNIEPGEIVSSPDITLTISKGNKITIPNLKAMTIEEITLFATQNKLKVKFQDRYDDTIEIGKIISTSLNEGDIVEEGTTFDVLSSKGQLKMEEFNNLEEFRTWATKYNIPTAEIFETNDEIADGQIIKFSHTANSILANGETVTIYISKGPAVSVPNLIGKTKASAISELNRLGLGYSISYSSYNNKPRDTVLSQSVATGTKVDKGTRINIMLSRGPGISIPYLIGKDKNAISSLCSSLGLRVNFATGGYSSTPANCAVSQSLSAGTKVDSGATITVTLSKGPAASRNVYIQPYWIDESRNPYNTASNITSQLKAIYSDLNVIIVYVPTNENNKGLLAMDPNITITQGGSITIKIYK